MALKSKLLSTEVGWFELLVLLMCEAVCCYYICCYWTLYADILSLSSIINQNYKCSSLTRVIQIEN